MAQICDCSIDRTLTVQADHSKLKFETDYFITNFIDYKAPFFYGRPRPSGLMRDAFNYATSSRALADTILKNFLRSKVTLESIHEEVIGFDYLNPVNIDVDHTVFQRAVETVRRLFKLPNKAHPIHFNEIYENQEIRKLLPLSHSAGLPYTIYNQDKSKGFALDQNRAKLRSQIHHLKTMRFGYKYPMPPVLITVRNHMVIEGVPEKVRGVYAYPLDAWLMETLLFRKLIDSYNANTTGYGLNVTPICGGLNRINSNAFKLAADVSKQDKTTAKQLIEVAFDIILDNLDLKRYDDGGIPVYNSLLHMFYLCRDYFINTPMQTPDGHCYVKYGGVPSGTLLTNLVDSLCMAQCIIYVLLKMKIPFNEFLTKFMGDDSIVTFLKDFDPTQLQKSEFIAILWKSFGYIGNEIKIEIFGNEEIEFLGYKLQTKYQLPKRDIIKLCASLLLPEITETTPEAAYSRLIGLSYAGGFSSEFLEFCRKCESYILNEYPELRENFSVSRNQLRFMRILGVPEDWVGSLCSSEKFFSLVSRGLIFPQDHLPNTMIARTAHCQHLP